MKKFIPVVGFACLVLLGAGCAPKTKAPVDTSVIPAVNVPVEPTEGPVVSTDEPNILTNVPVIFVKDPVSATDVPAVATNAPVAPTKDPVSSVTEPVVSVVGPGAPAPIKTPVPSLVNAPPPATTVPAYDPKLAPPIKK